MFIFPDFFLSWTTFPFDGRLDHITSDMLKKAPQLLPDLTHLYNQMLYNTAVPEQFADSLTVLLHKKGDLTNISNYRPISLLSAMYKLLMRTILLRIERSLDHAIDKKQAGFRKGLSTTHQILSVCQLIERCNEYQMPLFLCFVDYAKASTASTSAESGNHLSRQEFTQSWFPFWQRSTAARHHTSRSTTTNQKFP